MYTIADLETISGVNRRNIHFYVQQGVLPPPEGAGLGARYSEEHLLRLRAIPILRNRGLRLDDIREKLAEAGSRELEQLLSKPQPLPGEARRAAGAMVSGRTVVRYAVAPGVEILVDGGLAGPMRDKVTRLIQEAQQLFSEEKGDSR
jgi:DNA-binding transcriptional MerR regulator